VSPHPAKSAASAAMAMMFLMKRISFSFRDNYTTSRKAAGLIFVVGFGRMVANEREERGDA